MRRFILLTLLAWLPIQASAMPWLAFHCEQEGSGIHQHALPGASHADESSPVNHHSAGGDDPDAVSGALACCLHLSGVVHTLLVFAGVTVTAGVPPHRSTRLHDFIPDLPKRPPLARLV